MKIASMNFFGNEAINLGYAIIDLTTSMQSFYQKYKVRLEYEHDSHWNKIGHEIVEKEILFHLKNEHSEP